MQKIIRYIFEIDLDDIIRISHLLSSRSEPHTDQPKLLITWITTIWYGSGFEKFESLGSYNVIFFKCVATHKVQSAHKSANVHPIKMV